MLRCYSKSAFKHTFKPKYVTVPYRVIIKLTTLIRKGDDKEKVFVSWNNPVYFGFSKINDCLKQAYGTG